VCLGKVQEQHKGIPIRRHRAWAHRPLLCQVPSIVARAEWKALNPIMGFVIFLMKR
jgi:hypothetical protein